MPELPDLQVFSRNLTKMLRGKKVKDVKVFVDKKLNVPIKELKKNLVDQQIEKVYREGKELHIKFKNGEVLGLHLMLRGQLFFFRNVNDHKFTILELLFSDDSGLAMTDFQRQATPTLNPPAREAEDALSSSVDFKFLKTKLQDSKAAVKNVLLDQHVIRGIGNAYADEILWQAKVSPFSLSNKIPDAQLKALAKSIKSVLLNAEKTILKTHPDIISGEFREFLKIHNSHKTHSPGGKKILVKKTGARKTYYTSEQKLFK